MNLKVTVQARAKNDTRTHACYVQTPWQPELFGFPKKRGTFSKFAIGKEQFFTPFYPLARTRLPGLLRRKQFFHKEKKVIVGILSLNLTFTVACLWEEKRKN